MQTIADLLYAGKRWLYRDGRPGLLVRAINWATARQYAAGILSPARAATMEVTGRRTGRPVSFPVVIVDFQGNRYVVSMLGADANWVRNVRASEGRAVLHRRGSEPVRLVEVAPEARAPILRRYLAVAPGARPHFTVDRRAPLAEFDRIVERHPVFRIDPR